MWRSCWRPVAVLQPGWWLYCHWWRWRWRPVAVLRLDILEQVEIRLETCCSVAGTLVCCSSMWRSCWWPVAVPLPGWWLCCHWCRWCWQPVAVSWQPVAVSWQPVAVLWSSWQPVASCGGHAGDLLQHVEVTLVKLLQLMEVTLVTCCSAVSLLMTRQFVAVYWWFVAVVRHVSFCSVEVQAAANLFRCQRWCLRG